MERTTRKVCVPIGCLPGDGRTLRGIRQAFAVVLTKGRRGAQPNRAFVLGVRGDPEAIYAFVLGIRGDRAAIDAGLARD